MTLGTWVGEPFVRRSNTMVEIEQNIDFGGSFVAWELWRAEMLGGEIQISSRSGGTIGIPPHVVPLVMEAMASLNH